MPCKHPAIRCTNNRFFCLLCGAEIDPPKPQKEKPVDKPAEASTTDKPKWRRKAKAD